LYPVGPLDPLYADSVVLAAWVAWAIVAIALLIGFRTWAASLINFGFALYFFGLRGQLAPHAADWIAQAMAFYLVWMRSDRFYSVDRWWLQRRGRSASAHEGSARVWPKRLAQIHFAGLYFTAGLSKLGDPSWMRGTAFGDSVRHPLLTHFSLERLAEQEALMTAINYAVIAAEVLVPVLLVWRRTRRVALIALLVFQVGIDFTFRIGWFTGFASAYLLLFADDLGKKSKHVGPQPTTLPKLERRLLAALIGFHLSVFVWTQLAYVATTAGARSIGRWMGEVPLVRDYAHRVARFEYFNVWPTSLFLESVYFLFYEATHADGRYAPLSPFDAAGAFAPSIGHAKEAREGILAMRIARLGMPRAAWLRYLEHLMRKYQNEHGRRCPGEIRIFRIAAPLDAFPPPVKSLQGPKQFLLRARIACTSHEPRIAEVRFSDAVPP
jgi:hypothetical protein